MTNALGKRIQKARKEFGLSQADLAYRMGISAQSISAFESGRVIPDFKYIEKIAQFTHQPVHFFTGQKAAVALEKVNKMIEEMAELKIALEQIIEEEKHE